METHPDKKILLIIPAYNEEEKIGEVISEVREVKKELDLIVIDDGSTDSTVARARSAGAKVFSLSSNMGYGVAVQTGYKYAFEQGYDYVVQLDADGQHEPAYLSPMLETIMSGEADLVVGSRFIHPPLLKKTAPNGYKAGIIRKSGIALFAFLVSKLTGLKITDPTSGYRAFNRRIIAFFVRDFFPYDYPDADVLVMAHRADFNIKELPMVMYARDTGASMYKGLKPVTYVFKMFLSILITLLRKKPFFNSGVWNRD